MARQQRENGHGKQNRWLFRQFCLATTAHSINARRLHRSVRCRLVQQFRLVDRVLLVFVMLGLCLLSDVTQAADLERIEVLFDQLEEECKRIPRTSFDAQSVVERVGQKPEQLVEWVRTHTQAVPYRGALRGHRGVLLDRVGNSLDRSLLLCELLRVSGIHSRLVRGSLNHDALQRLLEYRDLRAAGEGRNHQMSQPRGSRNSENRRPTGDGGTVERELRKMRQSTAQLLKSLRERTDRQAKGLLDALESSGVPAETASMDPAESNAWRDHWWVQWHTGSNWRDLDPSIPGGNQTLTRPESRLEVKRGACIENVIPSALRHRVTIRVLIEQAADGKLLERELLHETLTPFELIGSPVILSTSPATGLDQFLTTGSSDSLLNVLSKADIWETSLVAGDRAVKRQLFDRFGNLVTPGRAGSLERAVASFNPLGGPRLPGPRRTSSGVLTGQWIEYRIHVPGRTDCVIRRMVFDHIGPSVRSAVAAGRKDISDLQITAAIPLALTEILPLNSNLSADWIEYCSVRALLEHRAGILDLLRGRSGVEVYPAPFARELMSFAAARFSAISNGQRLFLAEPNVISFHRQVLVRKSAGKNGRPVSLDGYDIVWNPVSVREGANPFHTRLKQGVRDTNLEALLMQKRCDCSPDNVSVPAESIGSVPVSWTLLRPEISSARETQTFTPDVRQRIRTSVRDGWHVLAPKMLPQDGGPVQSGWWRIHPGTGTTLGFGARGWGQSSVETMLLRAAQARSLIGRVRAAMCLTQTVMTNDRAGSANCLMAFFSPSPLLYNRLSPLLMNITQEVTSNGTLLPVPD